MTSQNQMEYGVDGVSGLPNGWVREPLKRLVEPRSQRVVPADQPDAPYIGLEHVEAHTNQILGTVPASAMTSSSAKFEAGDVLYGRMRPYLNKVVKPEFSGLASAEFIIFPKVEALDSNFLLRRLSAIDFVEFACSQYEGDRPRVKFDALGEFQIDLPPRAEQTRIVAKLEELLSELDAGVAELKAAQRKLVQYRQSLLKAAVSGELTTKWRAAHALNKSASTENGQEFLQRILRERRTRWEAKQLAKFQEQGKTPPKDWQHKYPEPVPPDTTNLPPLPEGWVWASVDMLLADIEAGKSFKCEERPPQNHEVGVVKVSAVTWGEYNEEESKTCHDESMVQPDLFVRAGDLLFSRANTIELVGACVIAHSVTKRVMLSDKILRLILVDDTLNTWLLTLLRSKLGRKYIEMLASGNQESMRNIGQERLRQIPVPLPSLDEIQMASEMLSANISAAKDQETAITHALKQASAQRQNILRAAFAGQLVPQDPKDEPASVLLERIRTERASSGSNGGSGGSGKKPRGRKAKEGA